MSKYRFLTTGEIMQDDHSIIPIDPDNKDYREWQTWVSMGGITDPAPPETVISDDFYAIGLDALQVIALNYCGYTTYDSLRSATDLQLDAVPGIGQNTVQMIRTFLSNNNPL